MERASILIKGFVQGVFFRAFIKERAIELGLTGYTKNTDRNKVEAVVEGHEAKIKKFIDIIRKGPPGSEIETVEISKQQYRGEFKTFSIKY